VFNSTTSYCCYDGIHDWSDSHCVPWKPKVSATPAGSANTVAAPASAPLNTCQNPNPTPCLTATTEYGCLNGYKYLWEVRVGWRARSNGSTRSLTHTDSWWHPLLR